MNKRLPAHMPKSWLPFILSYWAVMVALCYMIAVYGNGHFAGALGALFGGLAMQAWIPIVVEIFG